MKEREREFNKTQMTEQGVIHNSAIDIPKRKDKEDLTESSEVQEQSLCGHVIKKVVLITLL